MSMTDRLEKLRDVKAFRSQLREVRMLQAMATANAGAELVQKLREQHEAKIIEASHYGAQRMQALANSKNPQSFFTTYTVGMYRMRRDVASIDIRAQKAEGNLKRAERDLNHVRKAYLEALNSQQCIDNLADEFTRSQNLTNELAEEEEINEILLSSGVK